MPWTTGSGPNPKSILFAVPIKSYSGTERLTSVYARLPTNAAVPSPGCTDIFLDGRNCYYMPRSCVWNHILKNYPSWFIQSRTASAAISGLSSSLLATLFPSLTCFILFILVHQKRTSTEYFVTVTACSSPLRKKFWNIGLAKAL